MKAYYNAPLSLSEFISGFAINESRLVAFPLPDLVIEKSPNNIPLQPFQLVSRIELPSTLSQFSSTRHLSSYGFTPLINSEFATLSSGKL